MNAQNQIAQIETAAETALVNVETVATENNGVVATVELATETKGRRGRLPLSEDKARIFENLEMIFTTGEQPSRHIMLQLVEMGYMTAEVIQPEEGAAPKRGRRPIEYKTTGKANSWFKLMERNRAAKAAREERDRIEQETANAKAQIAEADELAQKAAEMKAQAQAALDALAS